MQGFPRNPDHAAQENPLAAQLGLFSVDLADPEAILKLPAERTFSTFSLVQFVQVICLLALADNVKTSKIVSHSAHLNSYIGIHPPHGLMIFTSSAIYFSRLVKMSHCLQISSLSFWQISWVQSHKVPQRNQQRCPL